MHDRRAHQKSIKGLLILTKPRVLKSYHCCWGKGHLPRNLTAARVFSRSPTNHTRATCSERDPFPVLGVCVVSWFAMRSDSVLHRASEIFGTHVSQNHGMRSNVLAGWLGLEISKQKARELLFSSKRYARWNCNRDESCNQTTPTKTEMNSHQKTLTDHALKVDETFRPTFESDCCKNGKTVNGHVSLCRQMTVVCGRYQHIILRLVLHNMVPFMGHYSRL